MTVAALVVLWLKIRSGALIITAAIMRNANVFIASVRPCNCNQSVASRNTGKVTPLLPINGEMLPEYDFSKGVRGKYAQRYARGSNVVVLVPDAAKVFPNAETVNSSLRSLAEIIRRRKSPLTLKAAISLSVSLAPPG